MTASYADPVDVQRRDGSPTAFCWRGRVYLVRGILAHWLETGPWWQSASLRALLATSKFPPSPPTGPPPGVGSQATDASRSTADLPARAGDDAGDREFWQVEAAAGRHATPGVYELCADWTTGAPGQWSVTTVAHHDVPADQGSP